MVAAVAAMAGLAAGCMNAPADVPPPPETRASDADTSRAVTGRAPRATGGFPSVVVLEPEMPGEFPVPTEPQLLDQDGMMFFPPVLLARVGQPVQFQNSEDVLHNVRVIDTRDGSTIFNIATPLFGAYEHAFDQAGTYAVSCDVHPGMSATIRVTSTPFAVIADPDGTFSFADVPPGTYIVTVWNGGRRVDRRVHIEGPGTELILDDIK